MQIKVTDLQTTVKKAKNGKAYSELVVFFEKDGEAKSRKMTSYDKANFSFFKDLPKGTVVNVTTTQNDEGYWEWSNPEKVGATSSTVTPAKTFKESDDLRQLRIVRQACLKAAAEQAPDYASTVALAEKYVQWVLALPGVKIDEVEEDDDQAGYEGVE